MQTSPTRCSCGADIHREEEALIHGLAGHSFAEEKAGFEATRPGFGYERPSDGITNDWITPRWVMAPLGPFDLDPCESNNQPWPMATRGYRLSRGEDGLLLPWEGRVYCNPPYGRETVKWIEKMALHDDGVMLIFARVETQAFAKIWQTAAALLFFPKRVTFCKPDGTAAQSGTAPSVLVAWGQRNVRAISQHKGALVTGWEWNGDESDTTKPKA